MAEAVERTIMPESDYDPVEAKFCASLFWLVFHATEDGDFDDIPPEITCPTERDLEGNFAVRPQVARFLCNGEVYFQVCRQVTQKERETDSFWSMIQELSNAGYYVIDTLDEAVTEERLVQQDFFDLDAHLALLDTLMLAHVNLSVNIQNVVNAVRTFATFNAAKELPFDLEDALLLWLNKINNTNDRRIQKTKSPESSSEISPRRFRFKKDQAVEKPANLFPKLDDLQSDLGDGKTLLSLVLFYCPDTLTHQDIKLSKSLTEDEIISNIELFRELCAQNICTSVFALRTEDFIYKAPELKNNLIALLGEIFTKVELEKTTVNSEVLGNGIRKSTEDRGDASSESDTRSNQYEAPGTVKGNETYRKIDDTKSEPKTQLTKHTDKVDLSIQDELQKLKILSSAKKEGTSSGASSPKVSSPGAGRAVKNRPPLLSKRSKKQLATFGEEDRCHSTEDLSGMQLVDFDLKRSHSMTSVVGKANYAVDPSHSMRAWEGGKSAEDMSKSKSQRISLDFKPDPKPFKSQSFTKTHLVNDEAEFHDIGSTEFDRLNPENLRGFRDRNLPQEIPSSGVASRNSERSDVDGAATRNSERLDADEVRDKQTKSRSTFSQGLAHSARASADERHPGELVDLDDTQESIDSISSEDLERFRSDVMQRANPTKVVGEIEPEFVEAELEDDDYFAVGKVTRHDSASSNTTPNTLPHGASPRPNRLAGLPDNVSYYQSVNRPGNDAKDIDDDLSTIAESSEPSTPTVYSFRSERSFGDSQSSPTIGSSYDTRNSFDDSQSPPILSDDITPLNSVTDIESSWSGVDASKSVVKSEKDFRSKFERLRNAAEQSRNKVSSSASQRPSTRESDNERYLNTPEAAPRTSYTILNPDMSIETAKAAGLPIIDAYDRRGDGTPVSGRSRNDPDRWGGEPHLGRTSQKSMEAESYSNVMVNERLMHERYDRQNDISKDSGLQQGRSDSKQGRNSDGTTRSEVLPQSSIYAKDSWEDGNRHVTTSREISDNVLQPVPRDGSALKSGEKSERSNATEIDGSGNHVHLDKQEEIAANSHDFQTDETDFSSEKDDPKGVNEKAYLSLDIDDVGESSISAFGVCIQPSNFESEDSLVKSPRSKNNNWTYMEVEVREEDPRKMFGGTNQTYVIPKENAKRPVNGEFQAKKKPDKKDLNSTTTWSEIQQEKNSLWSQLKSPRKDKNHCITKVVDGPIINWAEYAKKREAEKELSEEDEDESQKSPRESLAPRLAILKMQLEEKRRHIEEEKKKMMEQWNEERLKLGQQAFWLTVGKESKEDREKKELEREAAETAERKKKPGLMFFPLSDENDPAKVLPKSLRKSNDGDSPPNECSTPLTPVPTHQRANRVLSIAGDYPVHQNRVGSTTIMEASRLDGQGETFIVSGKVGEGITIGEQGIAGYKEIPNDVFVERQYHEYDHRIPDENQGGPYDDRGLEIGIQDMHRYGRPEHYQQRGYGADNHPIQPDYVTDRDRYAKEHDPHEYPAYEREQVYNQGPYQGAHAANDSPSNPRSQRTAWGDPMKINAQDFPVYQASHIVDTEASLAFDAGSAAHYHPDMQPHMGDRTTGAEGYTNEQHVLGKGDFNRLPMPSNGDPGYRTEAVDQSKQSPRHKSPREAVSSTVHHQSPRTVADPARDPSVFMETQQAGIEYAGSDLSSRDNKRPVALVIPSDDSSASPGEANPMIMHVAEELESGTTTLTPEQQKKREKFLQNRMKRQQEEKVKREAEQEKRRRKEEKLRERKALFERKELEEQEKRRKQKQEEEEMRRRQEEEIYRQKNTQRGQRKDEEWSTPPSRRHVTPTANAGIANRLESNNTPPGTYSPSTYTEYKGPPVYVKPTGKSNRQIMVNAISYCCLSGEVNREAKEKSLQVLSNSNATHFFVLFRDGLKYRGLFAYVQEADEAQKIYGVGPKVIVNKMVERLFKYSSGAKSFSQIPAKSLSIQVDGIQIKKEFWQSSKAGTSKTDSNLRKGGTPNSRSDQLKKGSPKTSRR